MGDIEKIFLVWRKTMQINKKFGLTLFRIIEGFLYTVKVEFWKSGRDFFNQNCDSDLMISRREIEIIVTVTEQGAKVTFRLPELKHIT